MDHCVPEEASSGTYRLFIRAPRHVWRIARDIGLYLAVGVLLAAIAKAFLTPDAIAAYLGDPAGWWAPFAAFPISVVIEACSEGFAIVAGQLHQMGASLSDVFVMTMVGVATDYTELSVVWGKFGPWTTGVYLTVGSTTTLLAGLVLQLLL